MYPHLRVARVLVRAALKPRAGLDDTSELASFGPFQDDPPDHPPAGSRVGSVARN